MFLVTSARFLYEILDVTNLRKIKHCTDDEIHVCVFVYTEENFFGNGEMHD